MTSQQERNRWWRQRHPDRWAKLQHDQMLRGRVRRALAAADPADRDRYLETHRHLMKHGEFGILFNTEREYDALGRKISGAATSTRTGTPRCGASTASRPSSRRRPVLRLSPIGRHRRSPALPGRAPEYRRRSGRGHGVW